MNSEFSLRQKMIEIGKLLEEKGLVVATDGNFSTRLPDGNILITPSGLPKGRLTIDSLVKIDLEGRKVKGTYKPSSEYRMHLEVYRKRQDVNAVVHTHSPYATAFAVSHIPLEPVVSEAVLTNGHVPVSPYATPSTEEVPRSISAYIEKHNAILLANHGCLAMGKDLDEAFYRAERIEFLARVMFISRLLGGEKKIPQEEIDKLLKNWGIEV
ncbi:class II aldolase/adducin family protein [bacterium]|uniref:Class II aldolase/adducin family protein n=1 Tax=candidate division WOR-3 bacterium TaxID=2052148 RepID=A0A7C0VCH4_UNCW3|nr:MAG: class II aldolase/adducin family protein [bacterium]HDI83095.1 class II aldolase/adducin family protein [candidate division WOR-3 bacterium]